MDKDTIRFIEIGKASQELNQLLFELGIDVLKRGIEIKISPTIADLTFSDEKGLFAIQEKVLKREVPEWKIIRLCLNLYNLLSDKGFMIFPHDTDTL